MNELINLGPLKSEAINYPEPLKTLILTASEEMKKDDFLRKFLEWRKTARAMEVKGK